MRRMLILYGTTDGHTGKVAAFVADVLQAQGARVDVVNAATRRIDPEPADYDGVIVAASVHIGSYQRAVRRWVTRHAAALNAMPSAFVSVCLGVLEHNPKSDRDLEAMMERLFVRTGWRPTVRKIVAGAMPYTRYGWLKRWVMVRIARKAHGSTDTTRDVEYTDWDDLKSFARELYVGGVVPVSATPLAS